jgi:HEAT repeat protein
LAHGDLRARLLAISTLGNLRDEAAWQALQGFAYHKDPHLSLTAARALLRINADAAVNLLVPLISTRKDWSLAKLANLFGEANPELIAQPLAEAALRADQMHAPRLIRLLNIARNKTTLSAVIDIISTCQDDETILACLSILEEFQEPKTLPILRKFLDHENWRIRVRSTVALGMIATPEDEQRFIALLSDPQWWVRYRAAQALAHQPFINSYKLARIRSELTDVFAREALLQAMAEMRFGISRQIMVKQRLAALKELEKVQTAQQSLSASGIIELPAPASADSSAAKIAEGGMQKCS